MKYTINRILLLIIVVYSVSLALFGFVYNIENRKPRLTTEAPSWEQITQRVLFAHNGEITIWGILIFGGIFVLLFTLFVKTSSAKNDLVADGKHDDLPWNVI